MALGLFITANSAKNLIPSAGVFPAHRAIFEPSKLKSPKKEILLSRRKMTPRENLEAAKARAYYLNHPEEIPDDELTQCEMASCEREYDYLVDGPTHTIKVCRDHLSTVTL